MVLYLFIFICFFKSFSFSFDLNEDSVENLNKPVLSDSNKNLQSEDKLPLNKQEAKVEDKTQNSIMVIQEAEILELFQELTPLYSLPQSTTASVNRQSNGSRNKQEKKYIVTSTKVSFVGKRKSEEDLGGDKKK